MGIKNYTTKVSADKTVGEVMNILARKGARKIMTEYDAFGNVSAVCFILYIRDNELPFSLPLRADSILKVLEKQKRAGELTKLAAREVTMDQARRIGWRILKDWIDAQLALVEIGMAQMEEVFMPYLYNPKTRKTLYEITASRNFQNLLPSVTEVEAE